MAKEPVRVQVGSIIALKLAREDAHLVPFLNELLQQGEAQAKIIRTALNLLYEREGNPALPVGIHRARLLRFFAHLLLGGPEIIDLDQTLPEPADIQRLADEAPADLSQIKAAGSRFVDD